MHFFMPVKVYMEKECVQNHGAELASLGSKALLVTGRHSSRINGSLEDVESALRKQGQDYVLFDEIEENPSTETVMRARDFGLQNGADYVIGIGGGSPLDAAKAIALMMKNANRTQELLYTKESAQAYPVAAIPTTCGTGSEVTPYAILTVHAKQTKLGIVHRVFPKLALIDGKYLATAKQEILANTAIDALGHFIESSVHVKATDYGRMLCGYGMEVWSRSKDVIAGNREGRDEDFENLMCASSMAGMAISHTGTSLPHGMSYKLTYERKIAHGKAVGIFEAAYLKRADKELREWILGKLCMDGIDELSQFVTQAVGTVEIDEAFFREAVAQMMGNERKLANCPYQVKVQDMEEMYRESCIIL